MLYGTGVCLYKGFGDGAEICNESCRKGTGDMQGNQGHHSRGGSQKEGGKISIPAYQVIEGK